MLITLNSGAGSLPNFEFTPTGGMTYTFFADSQTSSVSGVYYFYREGNNWEFYMLTSGVFHFLSGAAVDIFLCGGGQGGRSKDGPAAVGGSGGARKTILRQILGSGDITVTVGAGSPGANPPAAGGASMFGGHTSAGGSVSSGGANYNTNGANGGYCFDDSTAKGPDGNSRRVGAGGGHGAYAETDGVNPVRYPYSNGGSYGGGKGGDAEISGGMTPYAYNGENGKFYGAGGGGSGAYANTSASPFSKIASGGSGHKGLVALRNAR